MEGRKIIHTYSANCGSVTDIFASRWHKCLVYVSRNPFNFLFFPTMPFDVNVCCLWSVFSIALITRINFIASLLYTLCHSKLSFNLYLINSTTYAFMLLNNLTTALNWRRNSLWIYRTFYGASMLRLNPFFIIIYFNLRYFMYKGSYCEEILPISHHYPQCTCAGRIHCIVLPLTTAFIAR